jgi:type I restriction enzyme S subunit
MAGHVGRTVTFDDLIKANVLLIGDGYRAKNEELGGNGIIFLRAGHVTDTNINFEGVERFHESLTDAVTPKMGQGGDAVVTTKGNSTGRVTFIREGLPPFVYSPHLSYWRSLDHEQLVPRFLYYWSRSQEFGVQLRGMSVSTDMAPYLSLRDQRRLEITLPPVEQQKLVANVLGSLDDKMDLNRRTNATLEAMAHALFQAWFVDFAPVRAKADGANSFPMMPQAVFDPLSAQLVESSRGVIPRGWRVGTIGEEVRVVGGGTPSTGQAEYWENGVHAWATPKDLSKLESPVLIETERQVTDAGLERISSGLLPKRTVLLSSRAPIGYLALAEVPTAINQGFIAMVCDKSLPPEYVLNWCAANMEEIKARANGTTFMEVSKANFRPIPLVVPDKASLQAFVDIVRPMYDLVAGNLRQHRTLAETRDTLLPKLMSGEVRVQS